MLFEYSVDKNNWLKENRGISFETVITYVMENKIIDIINNPTRENQFMYIFKYEDLIHVCPFVSNEDRIFLKTIFPNRKIAKLYEEDEK
ncbi:MAG: toxin [Spirochaetia bacterium]|jgi:hypothetical protein|nr:toxin [Spirochaetia bacterium]